MMHPLVIIITGSGKSWGGTLPAAGASPCQRHTAISSQKQRGIGFAGTGGRESLEALGAQRLGPGQGLPSPPEELPSDASSPFSLRKPVRPMLQGSPPTLGKPLTPKVSPGGLPRSRQQPPPAKERPRVPTVCGKRPSGVT